MIWSHREYTETTNYPILFEKSSRKLSKFQVFHGTLMASLDLPGSTAANFDRWPNLGQPHVLAWAKGPSKLPAPGVPRIPSSRSQRPWQGAAPSPSVQPQSKPCYRNGPWSSALDIVLEVVLSFPGKEHTNRMCTWNNSCHTLWPFSWSFGPPISRVAAIYANAFKSRWYAVYNYRSLPCVVSSWSDTDTYSRLQGRK